MHPLIPDGSIFDLIMEFALVAVFFMAGGGLVLAAATGPKNARWLRYLGALVSLSFGAFYFEAALISLGKASLQIELLVAWSRFNAGIVASLAVIWVMGRPDRKSGRWMGDDLDETYDRDE